jgi:hypothetical protein
MWETHYQVRNVALGLDPNTPPKEINMQIIMKDGTTIRHVKRIHFYLYQGEMPDELAYITEQAVECDCVNVKDVERIEKET